MDRNPSRILSIPPVGFCGFWLESVEEWKVLNFSCSHSLASWQGSNVVAAARKNKIKRGKK